MALKVSNRGEFNMLTRLFKLEDTELCLFTGVMTPAETDTELTYTQPTTQGYVAKTLNFTGATSWSISEGTGTPGVSFASYVLQQFDANGVGAVATIGGYFVRYKSSGAFLFAEADPNPFALANVGDSYRVTPRFELE